MTTKGLVAVAVPAYGPPTWGLLKSLLALQVPDGAGWAFTMVEKLGVEQARDVLAVRFLESKAEWLLFVDQDAVLHPQTVGRLLSWDKPFVSALAFTRTPPPQPTIYIGQRSEEDALPGALPEFRIQIEETRAWLMRWPQLWQNGPAMIEPRPDDALVEVDFTGLHCTLIHRSVLETVPPPYFERAHPVGGSRGTGEDYMFCRKAASCGFKIHVDRSVQAGHLLGEVSVGALGFLAYDRITNWGEGRFDVEKPDEGRGSGDSAAGAAAGAAVAMSVAD